MLNAGTPNAETNAENAVQTEAEALNVQNGEAAETTAENAAENVSEAKSPDLDAVMAKLARMEAELTKEKNKNNALSKENADQKRQLRSYKTAEEIRAEEEQNAKEELERRLSESEKRLAIIETTNRVLAIVNDEKISTAIAEGLYGAADAEAVLANFERYIANREKKLKAEYGKITGPAAGGDDAPAMTLDQLKKLSYKERVEFATAHPAEYAHLMGRGKKNK